MAAVAEWLWSRTPDRLCRVVDGGNLVVKITDSWLECHEFEPNTAEDPPTPRLANRAIEIPQTKLRQIYVIPKVSGVFSQEGRNQLEELPRINPLYQKPKIHWRVKRLAR
ncbi:hypothetical protein TNCV_3072322 [Trichonephila clavipes]|nr:hypothetical protein TNCV_3072322 [Trichonephila clavipes]